MPFNSSISDVTDNYRVAKTTNPLYLVDIWCPGHGFGVQVDMPEQLALAVSSEWESRLPSTIAQAWSSISPLGGGAGQGASNIFGWDAIHQGMSFQMWVGTTPIEIPLTVLFDAEDSGLKDVYAPIAKLQSIALPRNDRTMGNNFLVPPGPNVGIEWGGSGYGVYIKIGRMMMFVDCILVSVNAVFDARLDNRGYPISGQIDMVIRTSVTYGRSDWLRAMGLGGGPNEYY